MSKGKKYYDAWLGWTVNYKCNLHCVYCWYSLKEDSYLAKDNSYLRRSLSRLLQIGVVSAIKIAWSQRRHNLSEAIDISALRKALNKTNKIYKFSFTGGEPFLVPNIIDACAEITKKHFLSISTNLTSGKISEFVEKIDPQRVVVINASCHIKELERLNLVDKYINNFNLCKERGFDITTTERAYPPLSAEAEKYKEFFKNKGIELRFAQFCGKYNGKLYPEAYTDEEIRVFGLEDVLEIKMFHSKNKPCNAGYNVCVVLLMATQSPIIC
jgi:organic radical activating enzyme